MAVAVWVRALLPQILGASAAASPAAGVPAKAGGLANGPVAAAFSEQEALSPALAARCFEYLDDLLRWAAIFSGRSGSWQGFGGLGKDLSTGSSTAALLCAARQDLAAAARGDCSVHCRSPAVKRSMYSGIAVRDGQPPLPIVPPPSVAQMQLAVHGPQRLQGDAAATVRSHQVGLPCKRSPLARPQAK